MFVDSFQIHALQRAAELGVTRGAVPIEHCVAIERLTAGAVTRRDLRPGDWYRTVSYTHLTLPTKRIV